MCDPDVPPVRADAGRLMQVLFNLLGNAQQALSSAGCGGKIVVHAGTAVEDGRRSVTVDVIDDGPGVPEAYINRVFEPFFTTRRRHRVWIVPRSRDYQGAIRPIDGP